MNKLSLLISPVIQFLKTNYVNIIAGVILIAIFCFVFYVTTNSLKKLKTIIFSSYPFDLFFPQGGAWSIGYFFIVIIALGLLIFLLAKGDFYLKPA
ncbi:MAG TPA: hypothetical protein VFI61_03220 [Patescibacteria group bacterium]|nr:hypothetical protein [Patescibacteria group bacterium]